MQLDSFRNVCISRPIAPSYSRARTALVRCKSEPQNPGVTPELVHLLAAARVVAEHQAKQHRHNRMSTAPAAPIATGTDNVSTLPMSLNPQRPSNGITTSKHKPLKQHIEEQLLQYILAKSPSTTAEDIPHSHVQELMHSSNLLHPMGQDVYIWLNNKLTGLRIRTQVGTSIHIYGVAFVDPRSPAQILHEDDAQPGQQISCFDYNIRQNSTLPPDRAAERQLVVAASGQPVLPCIGVMKSAEARKNKPGLELKDQFLTYPIEACCIENGDEKYKGPGCSWQPCQLIHATQTYATVPPWIADVLNSAYAQSQQAAAALASAPAPAPASRCEAKRPATAPAAASSSSSSTSSRHLASGRTPASAAAPVAAASHSGRNFSNAAASMVQPEPAGRPQPPGPAHSDMQAGMQSCTGTAAIPQAMRQPASVSAASTTTPSLLPGSAAAAAAAAIPAAAVAYGSTCQTGPKQYHNILQDRGFFALNLGALVNQIDQANQQHQQAGAISSQPDRQESVFQQQQQQQLAPDMSMQPSLTRVLQHAYPQQQLLQQCKQQMQQASTHTTVQSLQWQQITSLPVASQLPQQHTSQQSSRPAVSSTANKLVTAQSATTPLPAQAAEMDMDAAAEPQQCTNVSAWSTDEESSCSSSSGGDNSMHAQISSDVSSNSPAATGGAAACNTVQPAALNARLLREQLHVRFEQFVASLVPPKDEKRKMRCVLDAVCQAIHRVHELEPGTGMRWTVAAVIPTGSFKKETNLTRTGDLDVLLKLICPSHASFDTCRKEVLRAVHKQLCQQPPHTAAAAATGASSSAGSAHVHITDAEVAKQGWKLKPCHSGYFLRLEHPVLRLQLDVQVAKYYGDTKEKQREILLDSLLRAATVATGGNHHMPPPTFSSSAGSSWSDSEDDDDGEYIVYPGRQTTLRLPCIKASRQRVTNLSELQAEVVKGVEQRYIDCFNRTGYGRLVTDVIRAVKAWSKFGLPAALQERGIAEEDSKGPPNYIWEIFVLFVLDSKTNFVWRREPGGAVKEGKVYNQRKPLDLFMDVMHGASVLLRSGSGKEGLQRAIIIEQYYTRAEALQPVFSTLWCEGELYTPYIINPVDPTYNCTDMQPFRHWDKLAEAAGVLYEQLSAAMQGQEWYSGNGRSSSRDSGQAPADTETAWTRLCRNSSLKFAITEAALQQVLHS